MLSNLASISKSLLAAFRRAWAFLKFNGFLKGFWVGIFVYFYRFIGFSLWLASVFSWNLMFATYIFAKLPNLVWVDEQFVALYDIDPQIPIAAIACPCATTPNLSSLHLAFHPFQGPGKVNATTECFSLETIPSWYKIWSINRVLLKNCSPDSSRKHLIPCDSPQTGQLPATPSAEAQPRGQMSWSQRIGGALAMSFCQIHFFFWLEDDRHLLRPAAASCRQVESTLP